MANQLSTQITKMKNVLNILFPEDGYHTVNVLEDSKFDGFYVE